MEMEIKERDTTEEEKEIKSTGRKELLHEKSDRRLDMEGPIANDTCMQVEYRKSVSSLNAGIDNNLNEKRRRSLLNKEISPVVSPRDNCKDLNRHKSIMMTDAKAFRIQMVKLSEGCNVKATSPISGKG